MLLTDVQRHVDASGIAGEAREERDEEAAKKGDAEGGELDVPVRVGISRHAARGRNKNSGMLRHLRVCSRVPSLPWVVCFLSFFFVFTGFLPIVQQWRSERCCFFLQPGKVR